MQLLKYVSLVSFSVDSPYVKVFHLTSIRD